MTRPEGLAFVPGNWAAARAKKCWQQLKKRYRPKYTRAILAVMFVALFVPVPGSALLGLAIIIVIAEAHRAISQNPRCPETRADLAEGEQRDECPRTAAAPGLKDPPKGKGTHPSCPSGAT